MVFLCSCSAIPPAHREISIQDKMALPPRYSMIIIIHGDNDYLYHDTNGQAHRADVDALHGAIRVALQNPQAEVFIFHERPRRHVLLFWPRRAGEFYYYRAGQRLAQESYWRDQGPAHFDPVAELYHRFHAAGQPPLARLFLYYGHEIPEFNGAGYDASYPDRPFTLDDLAAGLKGIGRDFQKFDLIVLATCFNGTPHTIATLAPYGRIIVASPENLHLSYFDLQSFARLDIGLGDGDMAGFAKKFAQQAFDRLTGDIQTAVTVAVYDVERVWGYVNSVNHVYDQAMNRLIEQSPAAIEHYDCAEDSRYVKPGMNQGVDIFYRPANFGRSKHKQHHSGWECLRQAPPSEIHNFE
jgi:hypothetical protein